MTKKSSLVDKGFRRMESDTEEDECVIDPYDYKYRVYLFGEESQDYDSDETEYKEP